MNKCEEWLRLDVEINSSLGQLIHLKKWSKPPYNTHGASDQGGVLDWLIRRITLSSFPALTSTVVMGLSYIRSNLLLTTCTPSMDHSVVAQVVRTGSPRSMLWFSQCDMQKGPASAETITHGFWLPHQRSFTPTTESPLKQTQCLWLQILSHNFTIYCRRRIFPIQNLCPAKNQENCILIFTP